MTRIPLASTAMALAVLLAACGGSAASPPRSPGDDTDPSTPTTADGKAVGADGVTPAQKLQEGPKLDSQHGVEPAATPPHE